LHDHRLGATLEQQLALIEQHSARAELHDRLCAVGDEQDGTAPVLDFLDAGETLSLEGFITHGQCLIDHQNVGIDGYGDGKGQPHVHSARIGFHGLLDEFADVGEVSDVIEAGMYFGSRHAEDDAVHVDVLPAGELRVEASAELQQSGNTTGDLDGAGR